MRTVGSRFSDKTVVLTKQSEEAYYDKFHYKKDGLSPFIIGLMSAFKRQHHHMIQIAVKF